MQETQRKIIRNTLANSGSFAFAFLVNLFLLPYIVHKLGPAYYGGIWVIIGALTAYLGLLDMGTGTAFVKYISEYYTKNDLESLNGVVNTGLIIYAVVATVLLVLAFTLDRAILQLVGVPAAILQDAVFVFRVGMVAFVLANAVSPLTSIIPGIQRMDLNAYASVGAQTLSAAGTVFALGNGYGVRGLIVNNLVVVFFNSTLLTALAFRQLPSLRLGARFFRRSSVRALVRYGLNLQVGRLADLVVFQTDRLFNLRIFGNVASAVYDVGAKLNSAARSLILLLISALIPAVAEIDARNDSERLRLLYIRGSQYIALAASFVFIFLAVFAPILMNVWMGPGYAASAVIVRILVIGYFFNVLTGVASAAAAGLGRTEFNRRFGVFVVVVNIAAIVAGAVLLGSPGIAAGTSLSLVLGALYFFRIFNRHAGIRSRDLAGAFGKPAAIGLFAAGVCEVARQVVPWEAGSRLESAALGAGLFLIYSIIFAVLVKVLHVFDEYDRNLIRNLLQRVLPNPLRGEVS